MTNPDRRKSRSLRRLDDELRQDRALALRRAGLSFDEIARDVGYRSRGAAFNAVKRALARVPVEDARLLRELEGQRLDAVFLIAWRLMLADTPLVSDGRIILDPDGNPIPDPEARLKAIDRLVRIMDRRAKLFGLDAPSRRQVEVLTEDVLDAEIARLELEMGATGGEDCEDGGDG